MFKTTMSGMNQTTKGDTLQRNGRGIMGQTFHHGISTAEKKLGSIKAGGMNYTRDHTFYYGDNVVVPHVKQAVKAMKDLTDPDLLKLKRPEWTSTVLVPNVETIHESFNQPVSIEKRNFEIRNGLRDETILHPNDPKIYPGTDTRKVYHDGWNVSIQCPNPLHQAKYLAEE
jgi:hypothetical protein